MALKGITTNTPPEAEPHIYAEDDAAIYQSIFGKDGVFNIGQKFKATVLSNNKVRIADGVGCIGGHVARQPYGEYHDMEIANGQTGYNRNDIIVAKFITTGTGGIDTIALQVVQGAAVQGIATDPILTQDDLYNAGKIREMPLYRVKIEGISIVKVEQMFKNVPTVPDLEKRCDELNSALENISGYSKTERKIGTWVNGSPLYEKTVEFSNIDIQNGVILQHGIPGINIVHDVCAIFMDGTVCNPFPIVDERGILLQIMANHSIVRFVGNVSYSAATSRSVRVTLRYTKD